MTVTAFTESDHPRGMPANAGQFRAKAHTAPDATLVDSDADQVARREAVREMLRLAPDGADRIVYELYSEGGEDEQFAFQCISDADGEQLEISNALRDRYWALGDSIGHAQAEDAGFERDSEMFTLQVPVTDPAVSAAQLQDAIVMHQYVTFVPSGTLTRDEADRRVHIAAAAHIRAVAGKFHRPVAKVYLARSGALGLSVHHTETAAGDTVHDQVNRSHPAFAPDRPLLEEISFAASNLRRPEQVGLGRTSDGLYVLDLNP